MTYWIRLIISLNNIVILSWNRKPDIMDVRLN